MYSKSLIVISILFFSVYSFTQTEQPRITADNFEQAMIKMNFEQPDDVSEQDFYNATETLKQINEKHLGDPLKFTSSVYWNYCSVFKKIKQYDLIEISFVKAHNHRPDVICELVNSGLAAPYQPHISKETFDRILNDCTSEEVEEEKWDLDVYCSQYNLDRNLVILVHQIFEDDQLEREYGNVAQQKRDLANQQKVDQLYHDCGTYVGESLVGPKLGIAMWAIIQHGETDYIEKYLPVLNQAVRNGELKKGPFQMTVDRYYYGKEGYQIFGSQGGVNMAPAHIIKEVKEKYTTVE